MSGRRALIIAGAGLTALLLLVLPAAAQDAGGERTCEAAPMPVIAFTDVAADATFCVEIAQLAETGITQGRADDTYGVNDPVTRGAMAAFLYRLAGSPPGPFEPAAFSDVPLGSAFATEIDWLAGTGITQGRGDGTYGAGDTVTRGAMAAFLYRLAGSPPGPVEPAGFSDVPPEATFASEIDWLSGTGITQGRGDGTYGPGDTVTRGAMAAFLIRFRNTVEVGLPIEPAPFVTTWDTRLSSGTTVTLGLAGTVDAVVDWGDGTTTTVSTPGPHVRTYATDGVYTVRVSGQVSAYNSAENGGNGTEVAKLVRVDRWGSTGFTSLAGAFSNAVNLTALPANGAGTANVTDMAGMFAGATSLTSVPAFGTSAVTDMTGMFAQATSLTSVPAFDTSAVTDMQQMFFGAASLTTVPAFDTSSVTDMAGMFVGAASLTAISAFDTSSVTDMQQMFAGATSLTTIPALDTSTVTNMNRMFVGAEALITIPALDTSSVTDMTQLFAGATSLITIPALDTSSVTDMTQLFAGATSLTTIPALDTSSVTDMTGMFFGASAFNADLSGWCVSQIPQEPAEFDTGADSWVAPRPAWGAACS